MPGWSQCKMRWGSFHHDHDHHHKAQVMPAETPVFLVRFEGQVSLTAMASRADAGNRAKQGSLLFGFQAPVAFQSFYPAS